MLTKESWPEAGELVIGHVKRITSYGAYVTLVEYEEKEGFIHISEVSSGWVKNIRDYLREGQRVVLRVLRVDAKRGIIDLSLVRVSGSDRRKKLMEWKQSRKAESIFKAASERLGLRSDEVEDAKRMIEEFYGSAYEGLRVASVEGNEALTKAGISSRIAEVLAKISATKIKFSEAKVTGILELTCIKSNGGDIIRGALMRAEDAKRKDVKVAVYTVGAPRYRVEVTSRYPKKAEEAVKEIADIVIQEVMSKGGSGSIIKVERT